MFWSSMSLILKQISSAFSLLVGLILCLSWFYWKDSDLWLLLMGSLLTLLGIVGAVFAIKQTAEENEF